MDHVQYNCIRVLVNIRVFISPVHSYYYSGTNPSISSSLP
jgi:hypothetical protein